jgi:hypothetical protein
VFGFPHPRFMVQGYDDWPLLYVHFPLLASGGTAYAVRHVGHILHNCVHCTDCRHGILLSTNSVRTFIIGAHRIRVGQQLFLCNLFVTTV